MTLAQAPVPIPSRIEEVDAAWLGAALRVEGVRDVSTATMGAGLMSDTFRLTVSGDRVPASLVLKLAAVDEGARRTAARHRAYEVEVGFYCDLAPQLGVRVPACHWADRDQDGGGYGVLLEDVAGTVTGDQIKACTVAEAAGAVAELALLHGPRWADPELGRIPWLERHADGYRAANVERAAAGLPVFLERYADRLESDLVDLVVRFAGAIGRYDRRGQQTARTIAHGDFRADNLLFGSGRVCLVDWQTAFLGSGLVDLSYFLGGSLRPDDRREHEERLVGEYHARLADQGAGVTLDECWLEYRRHAFEGLAMAVVAAAGVKRTDRGDELFVTMAERAGRHALDLDSEELLD